VRKQTEGQVQENSTLTGQVGKVQNAKYEATASFENRKADDD